MATLIDRVSHIALDLLFPPQCALCRASGSVLCERCVAALPPAAEPRCDGCWDDVVTGGLCRQCTEHARAFEWTRAPYAHEGDARTLVHLLKYRGLTSLAEPMAAQMLPPGREANADLVVPVPLHPRRERSRGYNQSALLARRVASGLEARFDARAARRVRATKPLAQSMGWDERARIVEGAFAADRGRVEGRRVLLVDDVITTGATLHACAIALREAGAASVRALVFVRA